jgi:hypothetical protein
MVEKIELPPFNPAVPGDGLGAGLKTTPPPPPPPTVTG